ncbi:MAG: sigma-70 family RNA polymerase sigma factor [Elusimicrobiota bacterium]
MTEAVKHPGAGARAGEDPGSAFALIVAEHQRLVYSLALRLTGDAAAAEDITQEAFLSAWKNLDRFRGESSLKNWLARIAVNKVRSYWRWKKLRSWVGLSDRGEDGEAAPLEERLPDDPRGRPEQAALAAELGERVRAAIAALPQRQREVAALRAQGLGLAEIGAILGVAEGTVKAHWFAARAKLEAALGEYL